MAESPIEQKTSIPGPVGALEMRISSIANPVGAEHVLDVGIVCHPHPQYQGTMDNKVVTTITRAWQGLGFATVRFNFRGVGASEGHYGNGVGEIEDCLAVFAWVRKVYPEARIWLAGFSFGAMVSTKVASLQPTHALISIAPAVQHFDFLEFRMPGCPWLIVQGEQDEVVPYEAVKTWFHQLKTQLNKADTAKLVTFSDASHFFHGQLNELKAIIQQFSAQNTPLSSGSSRIKGSDDNKGGHGAT